MVESSIPELSSIPCAGDINWVQAGGDVVQVGNDRTPLVPDLQGLCLIENIAKRPMGVCEPWGVSNHITSGSGTRGTEDYMMKVIFHTEDYTSISFPFLLF